MLFVCVLFSFYCSWHDLTTCGARVEPVWLKMDKYIGSDRKLGLKRWKSSERQGICDKIWTKPAWAALQSILENKLGNIRLQQAMWWEFRLLHLCSHHVLDAQLGRFALSSDRNEAVWMHKQEKYLLNVLFHVFELCVLELQPPRLIVCHSHSGQQEGRNGGQVKLTCTRIYNNYTLFKYRQQHFSQTVSPKKQREDSLFFRVWCA